MSVIRDQTAVQPSSAPALHPLRWLWEGAKQVIKRPFYSLYERRLSSQVHAWSRPRHIGVIMDGNRRFARLAGLGDAAIGHARGAEKLREVLEWCFEAEIPVVTVWCFSLDNFQRAASEVEALFALFENKTREMEDSLEIHRNQVRVRYIGKLELLPESLQTAIRSTEAATERYRRFSLNIAMAYGGREEISDAFRRYLEEQAGKGRSLDEVIEHFDRDAIEPHLYTFGMPEPDLILRTSGEVRLSGFLLWQSAYSEFYFCDTNWPAFRKIDFLRALRSYHDRQRRFGR